MVAPYFERDGIVIYHGDCRDILPSIEPASVGLLLSDPPYGINLDTANAARGRGGPVGGRKSTATTGRVKQAIAHSTDYPPVFGDAEPFDPSPLLAYPRLILFGANHFAPRLPDSPSWLVWDKTAGLVAKKRLIGFCDNADAELIWTNLGGPVRILGHQWIGLMKATERGVARVHPTQKPVALLRWLIEMYSKPGDLILDPYMGSGSTLEAARDTGRRCIGIEVSEAYCEIAARRLDQLTLFGSEASA